MSSLAIQIEIKHAVNIFALNVYICEFEHNRNNLSTHIGINNALTTRTITPLSFWVKVTVGNPSSV